MANRGDEHRGDDHDPCQVRGEIGSSGVEPRCEHSDDLAANTYTAADPAVKVSTVSVSTV